MASSRKTSSRGGPAEDPERTTNTVAKASALAVEDDPERVNPTIAKASNPLPDEDPERDNKTNARKPAPKRRAPSKPLMPAQELDEGSGYSTGQNYHAVDEEEPAADPARMSLDGDGLDALDPELVPKTKALPALERDDTAADASDEEGADDDNATRAGPPIKLEIIAGPDAGKKRRLKSVRMVIGRMPGVELQLTDQSVSRRHVELVHSDEGTLLRDLGSGNGTKLNGKKIAADTMLSHGDEIQIGKTKLRFVDELAAFKKAREDAEKKEAEEAAEPEAPAAEPEPEAQPDAEASSEEAAAESPEGEEGAEEEAAAEGTKSKAARDRSRPVRTSRGQPAEGGLGARLKALNPKVRLAIVGGSVVVLLLLVIGLATRKPPPPPVDARAEEAALRMQEARAAAKEGRYEDTVKAVEAAEILSPGIDKTKLGLQAREALAVQRSFEQVQRYIDDKRFEDAKKLLAETPKANAKNESDRVKLEEALGLAVIAYHKDKVKEFLAAGEVESARQELAQVPADQLDDLPQQIEEFERTLEESRKQDAKDARIAAANAAAVRKAKREEEIALAFAIVERKFAGGEWERAASECSRVIDAFSGDREIGNRAKSLAGSIPNFGRNYDEGMRKYRQGQLTQAAKPLRLAAQSYRSMGLVQNRYGEELSQALLKAAISAGKEALLREDLENAVANFREARRIDSQDPEARRGFEGVADKAEDLYHAAYTLKDRDPREALRRFKVVIAVTEAGSPVHEKAKNQVAAMAP